MALGAGVLLYFQSPWAAPPLLMMALMAAALAARWAGARYLWRTILRWAVAALAWAALGYGAAGWRTWDVAGPVMPDTDRAWTVEGWAAKLDPGARPAVTIAVTRIAGLSPEETPARVRVRVSGEAPMLGEGLRVRAGLGPPPGPSAPGDYDFSRQAYFDRLGGTGFSYGAAQPADIPGGGFTRAVAHLRGAIGARIRGHVPDHRGGILVALVTGDRSGVAPADTDALRASGLAHVLAISGLHMMLVGGGVLAFASLVLAAIGPLARSYDIRKPAALCALAAATGYLMISGAPVSAQRAWVMLSVMLIALIFDRRALTLRNVAVAAVIVLLLAPESLFEAGFQMSFAATAGLIAAYEALRARRLMAARERSLWAGGLRFFGSLSMTSLVAGAATGGFAAYHFNRMATYGMAGNLAAMPVFTLWVMPTAAIGVALMPIGLEGPALKLSAMGLGVVLRAGEIVAGQAGALTPTASAPPLALGIYSLGFVLICAGRAAVRAGGLAAMGLAGAIWMTAPHPLLWISDSAVVAGTADGAIYATDRRRSRYGVDRFAQRQGLGDEAPVRAFRDIAECDGAGCVGWLNGVRVAAPQTRAAVVEDCAAADVDLIAFREPVSARLRRTCGAVLLDGGVLGGRGAATVSRDGQGELVLRHADATAWRPPYADRQFAGR